MTTANTEYKDRLHQLAELMLAVSGESVTMMKRNAPAQALKLKRQEEWGIYLEFLKIMFNLTDRLVALHIPMKDQMEFMNGLEDTVTQQLKHALEPAFGNNADQMEIVMTIGTTVAESRQVYEKYKFLITEDSKTKNEMFHDFGEKVAEALGTAGNAQLSSAATLCATAAVPALSAVLQGHAPPSHEASQVAPPAVGNGTDQRTGTGQEIKLVSLMSSVLGEEVETRWGLHPRFREDLTPSELQQLTKLLNQVAKILGERYAAVAFSKEWASWHKAGHA
ncbi:MAG: hypothetical protein OEV99_01935 [Nitrospira sp.]|nr:hypothetical protein [Nitrospira sp.]MDH4368576.1 hypothetical protein [Nitrospira sp.]MDH5346990.1 hypothetical protein [Nitrospira sp.]MDH5498494.1 hypothetical protein [Nitrospira sp.]MDH5725069.1 hypothetical protein [Nitrospira sp.]